MKATLETPAVDPSLSAFGPARATVQGAPLKGEDPQILQRFWRASNYLAVGMIYLQDNPLLKESPKPEHVKRGRGCCLRVTPAIQVPRR
jgi:xylulose-5-phosphate/fructose-6-phosphate phosphoketolase